MYAASCFHLEFEFIGDASTRTKLQRFGSYILIKATSMEQQVRVLIADDQRHTRQGLQALLAAWPEIEVVGAAADCTEAVELVEKCRPDVALMDIPMPVIALPVPNDRPGNRIEGMDGLETIHFIKSRWPQVRIVVLTMYAAHRAAALAAGADAFLLKGCSAQDLLEAITSHAALSTLLPPSGQG